MESIVIFIALYCGYKIFKEHGQARFNWFVCSILVFSSAIIIINKPQLPIHRFFLFCYAFSILKKKEYTFSKFPLRKIVYLFVFVSFLIGLNSSHLSLFYKFYKPFNVVIETVLVIIVSYYGMQNVKVISNGIVRCLFIISIYGIITFIFRSNPIHEFLASTFDYKYLYNYYWGERVRINSTWSHPIAYGFVCSIFFYIVAYLYNSKFKYVLLILLFINILICGSRTAIITWIGIGICILLCMYKIRKVVKKIILILLLSFPIFYLNPYVKDKMDSIVNTIQGNTPEESEGSSLQMRSNQLMVTMLIFIESPVWGHGYDYIQEEMGFNTDKWNKVGAGLHGVESILYILLIERGIMGILIQFIFWFSILYYAYRKRKNDKLNYSLIVSVLVGFIFFSIFTGSLDTPILVYFYIGSMMYYLSNKQMNLMSN